MQIEITILNKCYKNCHKHVGEVFSYGVCHRLKGELQLAWPRRGCRVHFSEKLLAVESASIAPGEQPGGKLSFVSGAPYTGLLTHIAKRIAAISLGQRKRIIREGT